MKYNILLIIIFLGIGAYAQKQPVDYVNPFIGTSNFGTTNPGPIAVRGMVSVSPFNVAGISEKNRYIDHIDLQGRPHKEYFISHDELIKGGLLEFILKE